MVVKYNSLFVRYKPLLLNTCILHYYFAKAYGESNSTLTLSAMFSLRSYSTFFIHLAKACIALQVRYTHYFEAFDVFSLCHRQILYQSKIKSPE